MYVAGMNAGMVVGPAAGGVPPSARSPASSAIPTAAEYFAAGLAGRSVCHRGLAAGRSTRVADTDEDKESAPPREARVPRTSWLPIGVYCFLSTFSIFYEDCYPLWLLTPRREGGMGYAVDEIGAVLSVTAVFTVAYQFLIFPFISARCPSHVLFPTSAGISAV